MTFISLTMRKVFFGIWVCFCAGWAYGNDLAEARTHLDRALVLISDANIHSQIDPTRSKQMKDLAVKELEQALYIQPQFPAVLCQLALLEGPTPKGLSICRKIAVQEKLPYLEYYWRGMLYAGIDPEKSKANYRKALPFVDPHSETAVNIFEGMGDSHAAYEVRRWHFEHDPQNSMSSMENALQGVYLAEASLKDDEEARAFIRQVIQVYSNQNFSGQDEGIRKATIIDLRSRLQSQRLEMRDPNTDVEVQLKTLRTRWKTDLSLTDEWVYAAVLSRQILTEYFSNQSEAMARHANALVNDGLDFEFRGDPRVAIIKYNQFNLLTYLAQHGHPEVGFHYMAQEVSETLDWYKYNIYYVSGVVRDTFSFGLFVPPVAATMSPPSRRWMIEDKDIDVVRIDESRPQANMFGQPLELGRVPKTQGFSRLLFKFRTKPDTTILRKVGADRVILVLTSMHNDLEKNNVVQELDSQWESKNVSWNFAFPGHPWKTPGGDLRDSPVLERQIQLYGHPLNGQADVLESSQYRFDITDYWNRSQGGSPPYGLVLRCRSEKVESNPYTYSFFDSKDPKGPRVRIFVRSVGQGQPPGSVEIVDSPSTLYQTGWSALDKGDYGSTLLYWKKALSLEGNSNRQAHLKYQIQLIESALRMPAIIPGETR